ncbi:hypothetical protein [Leptospira chreensis]|uniref:hypothetical protein n=1 Tax=Leptospira chreensis TaxID=2810035 RepID=UPI001964723E|nr:hypothetical protein [Leptospira chreensis]
MYHIQCVEKTLSLIIVGVEASNRKTTSNQLSYEIDIVQNKTFGNLLTNLKNTKTKINSDTIIKLELALKERNRIAHDYWWEKAVTISKEEGIQEIINELSELTDFFINLDKELMIFHKNQYNIFGITEDQVNSIKQEFEKLDKIEFPKERILNKTETVNKVSKLLVDENNKIYIPIFYFIDDSTWTFGDNGLYRIYIDSKSSKLYEYKKFQNFFPCEISTKINFNSPWNYTYKMTNGKILRISKESDEGFEFTIY